MAGSALGAKVRILVRLRPRLVCLTTARVVTNLFSVRIGTILERSHAPLRNWTFAIYLEMTSLKGIAAMKLHREIGVSYKTAWFMLHRIREAWKDEEAVLLAVPIEVDEAYFGGRPRNVCNSRRKALQDTGRGPVGKNRSCRPERSGNQHGSCKGCGAHRCGNATRFCP